MTTYGALQAVLGCRIAAKGRHGAVFIASAYQDLKDYRQAVYLALRRLGHQSDGVEEWAATDQPPVRKNSLAIQASDVVVFLVAWRYGYVPAGQQYSITELDFKTARDAGIPCLIFLVDEGTPWPRAYIDDDRANIQRFRQSLLEQYVVAFFKTPDELGMLVAASLHQWVASGSTAPSLTALEARPDNETTGPEVFLSYAHEDVGWRNLYPNDLAERTGLYSGIAIFRLDLVGTT